MTTINDIVRRNQDAGHHFFDDASMRFFDSKVYDRVFSNAYFVTSEQAPAGLRRYSVRRMDWASGAVETIGDFQEFDSLRDAYRAAEKYAKQPA